MKACKQDIGTVEYNGSQLTNDREALKPNITIR